MRPPSGENVTLNTAPSCPPIQRSRAPLSASQTRTVLSSEPLAMRRPSGEYATLFTASVCPESTAVWGVPRWIAGGRSDRSQRKLGHLTSLALRHDSNIRETLGPLWSQGGSPIGPATSDGS